MNHLPSIMLAINCLLLFLILGKLRYYWRQKFLGISSFILDIYLSLICIPCSAVLAGYLWKAPDDKLLRYSPYIIIVLSLIMSGYIAFFIVNRKAIREIIKHSVTLYKLTCKVHPLKQKEAMQFALNALPEFRDCPHDEIASMTFQLLNDIKNKAQIEAFGRKMPSGIDIMGGFAEIGGYRLPFLSFNSRFGIITIHPSAGDCNNAFPFIRLNFEICECPETAEWISSVPKTFADFEF